MTLNTKNQSFFNLTKAEEETLLAKGYVIGAPLSSGGFSRVYRATKNNEPCAVKVINLCRTSPDYRLKFSPRELYVTKKIHHPYIIPILDMFSIRQVFILIFMELAEGGTLLNLLKDEGALR